MRTFLSFISVLSMSLQINAALWEKLPSIPEEKGNFVCGTAGDNLLIAGGITWKNETKLFQDDVWIFNTQAKSWQKTGTLPHAVAYAASGQTSEGIYYAGGSDGTNLQGSLYLLNAKGEAKSVGTIEWPVVYSASAIVGSKLFVIAGATDPADLKTSKDDFYAIDLANGKAEMLPAFPGGKWIVPTATAIGDKIFVFTGAYQEGTNPVVNAVGSFVYSTKERTWKTLKPYPIAARGVASVALDNRYILLAGGYTNDFTDAAFIYDTQSETYLKTEPLPYRAMSTFIKSGEYLYWMGGEDKMRHRSDLCYRIRWQDLIKAAKPL